MSKSIKNMIDSDKFNWFIFFVLMIFIVIFYNEITNSNSIFVTFFEKFIPLKIPYISNIIALGLGLICLMIAYIIAIVVSNKVYDIISGTKDLFDVFDSKKKSQKIDLLGSQNIGITDTGKTEEPK